MKPFRRTGSNVPLNCPLPKRRARGSWGTFPHACFSCFVLFASSKENEVASAKPASQLIVASEQFITFLRYACLFDCLDNGRRNWNALRPRGPFLFRSAGKGSKRGRFARHFGSGNMKPRSNPFGEPSQTQPLTRLQTHGKVRFCPTGKNPLTSHAVGEAICCLGLQKAF